MQKCVHKSHFFLPEYLYCSSIFSSSFSFCRRKSASCSLQPTAQSNWQQYNAQTEIQHRRERNNYFNYILKNILLPNYGVTLNVFTNVVVFRATPKKIDLRLFYSTNLCRLSIIIQYCLVKVTNKNSLK